MDSFRGPAELKFSGNLSENWKRWKQKLDNYLIASENIKKPDLTKVAILLNFIGDSGIEVFNTFKLDENAENYYETVLKKYEDYCMPRKNVVFERYKFFSCSQMESEPIDHYVTNLKTLASTCEFGDQEQGLIRDRIVLGLRNLSLQERLLREQTLTLEKAAELVRNAEVCEEQLKAMKDVSTVQAVKCKQVTKEQVQTNKTRNFSNFNSRNNHNKDVYDCKKCGKRHKRGECFAYGKTCNKCFGRNHFAIGCTTKPKPSQRQKINELTDDKDESELFVSSICSKIEVKEEIGSLTERYWTEIINVAKNEIEFKLDTGAEINVLPLDIYKKILKKNGNEISNLERTSTKLVSYGDFELKSEGQITVACSTKKGYNKLLKFSVIDVKSKPLLGLGACVELQLIKRVHQISENQSKADILREHKDVFNGLGEVLGKEHHIELKKDAVPVIHPPRRVPQILYDKLKLVLNQLEAKGVVSQVNAPTDWVQSLVIVEKPDGNLRLCLDPRELNQAIKREHHMIPIIEEIISRLSGKKFFSVLDLKDGFWHVKLDEESAKLCTFNTPFGRYQFNRLPFGIASAPEVFQKTNVEIFGNIPGVEIYFDDIIVSGIDIKEHDANLSKVLERAKQCGVKFNENKFQLRATEVKYMGQIISQEGIKPDPEHIKAILKMEQPKDKKGIRRLLGMINFLSKFIPNVSQITATLRDLTRKDVRFDWNPEHDKAFETLKNLLTTTPVLKVFDSKEEIVIQCDSSQDGLGACLLQKGKPVSFISRALTENEKNFAQIEKELLAIVYSVEKYHNFVYGRKIIINSDHKPLETIVKKPVIKVSARLQRMLLKLLKYDIEIKYLPGSQMFLADTLSRAFLKETVKEDPELLCVVHTLSKYLPITDERRKEFVKATKEDDVLINLTRLYKEGWPQHKSQVPINVRFYWNIRSRITVEDDLVFLDEKLIVPDTLREYMLNKVHESHFGMTKCKSRAREVVYWPGMTRDIENKISRCKTCEKFGRSNVKETMMSHPVPERPWQRLSTDILQFGSKDYLVIADSYSRWIEILELKGKTAEDVIECLKSVFARYGIPEILMSDNMPFGSYEFKKFASEWDFVSSTSSPLYPKSNGFAEKMVSVAKNMLRKAKEENQDIYVPLMEYRNTPLSDTKLSPAQVMLNRRIRTKLPTCSALLKPRNFDHGISEKLKQCRSKQKLLHDRNAKDLEPLKNNENVLIRNMNNKVWEPAKIMTQSSSPRSYTVQNEQGNFVRRNRVHLRSTPNQIPRFQVRDNETPGSSDNEEERSSLNPSTESKGMVNRYGRKIRKPNYLKDYV